MSSRYKGNDYKPGPTSLDGTILAQLTGVTACICEAILEIDIQLLGNKKQVDHFLCLYVSIDLFYPLCAFMYVRVYARVPDCVRMCVHIHVLRTSIIYLLSQPRK